MCVTEVFAKQGKEQERDSLLLEWRRAFAILKVAQEGWIPLQGVDLVNPCI